MYEIEEGKVLATRFNRGNATNGPYKQFVYGSVHEQADFIGQVLDLLSTLFLKGPLDIGPFFFFFF